MKKKLTTPKTLALTLAALFLISSPFHTKALALSTISNVKQDSTFSTTLNAKNRDKFIKNVPLFNQCDYPNTPYGNYGTIESHGCGLVTLAMIATYFTNQYHSPIDLAEKYGGYNTPKGSSWSLFEDSAKDLGFPPPKLTYSFEEVEKALKNNQIVISIQGKGLFTSGGHFILLTSMTNDNKIFVNDPYGKNWDRNETLRKGFEEGFTIEQIEASGGQYWIYEKKA